MKYVWDVNKQKFEKAANNANTQANRAKEIILRKKIRNRISILL